MKIVLTESQLIELIERMVIDEKKKRKKSTAKKKRKSRKSASKENCPTDPQKWSYAKSQAKKKYDVYPSAYANGWAAKKYKELGGGWKKC